MQSAPALFWTEPRLADGDFSPEDPLAIDYLGQQIGNWLWPGFTTRTARAGYYPMVVYGLHLCEKLAERHHLPRTDETIRAQFERWEKLWALAICESFGGNLPPQDVMRGQRGTVRHYRDHRKQLRFDFKLLSRQLELGALGAYLTSLRTHDLVSKDRLRPTPLGAQLASRMWEENRGTHHAEREAFALAALEPGVVDVCKRHGRVTLASFGQDCRLSRVRRRPELQEMLWKRLFSGHPPPPSLGHLRSMGDQLVSAHEDGVTDASEFLRGLEASRWGALGADPLATVKIAVAFGDLSACLRGAFDRAYQAVFDGGFSLSWSEVAGAALPADNLERLRRCHGAWKALPEASSRFASQTFHGKTFVRTITAMSTATPSSALGSILSLHSSVQRDRGRSSGWLRRDGDLVLLELGGYGSWSTDDERWVLEYKTSAMRSMLRDLGRIA